MNAYPQLDHAIGRLRAILASARSDFAAGNPIDLAGLAENAERLCRDVVEVPVDDRSQFAAEIGALVSDLDALEEDIKRLDAPSESDTAS